MEIYDLIVVGGGPGGYKAALQAASLGKSVLLFEADQLGGTCLNRGCIPTKTMLRSSRIYHEAKNSASCGVIVSDVTYDMQQIHDNMANVRNTLRSGIEGLLKKQKVKVVNARAKIVAPKIVEADGESYQADAIILATGSESLIPPIPGIETDGVHTVEYFLENPVDIKSLIIVGGGVVGVEIAQIYHRLGCKVTIIEGLQRLLPGLDREVGQSLGMNYKKQGIHVITSAMVSSFSKTDVGISCTYTDKSGESLQEEAEKVLICIGRRANTKEAVSEDIDLQMVKGFIPVNEHYETCVKGIYAIGDIVLGGMQLAHVAEAQGVNVVRGIYAESEHKNMKVIPACVFTEPEIATVGISADEAKEKELNVYTVKKLTSSNGRSLVENAERGFVKLIVDKESNHLLGATLMCTHAGEMISGITSAIAENLTLEQIEHTVFPHPTISETIVE